MKGNNMSSQRNPIVAIAGIICGVSIPIVLIIGIFNKEKMWVAAPVIAVLALMGIILAVILSRKEAEEPTEPEGPPKSETPRGDSEE
ncbi:MAG: hypothetical protein ACYTF6_05800 [Planctomycetota bacterium]|jgi:hypothetical protein